MLPEGFVRHAKTRAPRVDVTYTAPDGKTLRSKPDAVRYLKGKPAYGGVSPEDFDFSSTAKRKRCDEDTERAKLQEALIAERAKHREALEAEKAEWTNLNAKLNAERAKHEEELGKMRRVLVRTTLDLDRVRQDLESARDDLEEAARDNDTAELKERIEFQQAFITFERSKHREALDAEIAERTKLQEALNAEQTKHEDLKKELASARAHSAQQDKERASQKIRYEAKIFLLERDRAAA